MSKDQKALWRLLSGSSDGNIHFNEVTSILDRLGFNLRIKGDHHIYTHENIPEIINIQPNGSMAKPYQVKQIRTILIRYGMTGEASGV